MSVQADASGMCQGRCGAADSGAPEITGAFAGTCAGISLASPNSWPLFLSVAASLFILKGRQPVKANQGSLASSEHLKGQRVFFFFFFLLAFRKKKNKRKQNRSLAISGNGQHSIVIMEFGGRHRHTFA